MAHEYSAQPTDRAVPIPTKRSPDVVAVHSGCSIISPAGAGRVAANLLPVAGEPIVLGSTCSAVNDVPGTDTNDGINRGEAGTGIHGVTGGGETDHPASAGRDSDCRIGEVVTRCSEIALQHDFTCVRIEDVPGESRALASASGIQRCIERTPELTVGIHHLLHAAIVGVWPGDDLRSPGMCRCGDE